jgi:hypothetical protein
MTTIPALFNTGTGRSTISSPQSQIPSQVENLVVLNQLTVNGNSFLQSDVEVGETLTVIGNSNLASVGISGDLSVGGVTSVASIGTDVNSQFQLPATSGSQNQVLTIASENPTITEWTDKSTVNDDFVKYDPVNEVLINSVTGVESNIDDLRLTSIGQSSAPFQLPATAPASNGEVLSILNSGTNPPTTEWKAIAGVTDFVSWDPSLYNLKNNINSVVTNIPFLRVGTFNNVNERGFVEFSRTDTLLNVDRDTRFQFESTTNGNGITLESFPTSGGTSVNAIQMRVDGQNNQVYMRSSNAVESKEVNATATGASLSSVNGARTNTVETTNTRVILSSESPGVGFNQNGIIFSTGSAGTQYVKMPQNTPQAGFTIRIQTPINGTGTQGDPYLTTWAL